MAYRAHIIVTDPNNGKPLGSTRLVNELKGLLRTGIVRRGTRNGRVGLWLERDSKSSFESALGTTARFFVETGYEARFGFTSIASAKAGSPMVAHWMNRGVDLKIERV